MLLALWASYGFTLPFAWSGPVRAAVIDERTAKPIGGAAIAAVWWVGSLDGSQSVIHRESTITDAQGRFRLRGMGLRVRPPFTWFGAEDPVIYVYAPGYETERLDNVPLSGSAAAVPNWWSPRRRCFWDEKTIPLSPSESAQAELSSLDYMRLVVGYPANLRADRHPGIWRVMEAGWKRLPRDVQMQNPTLDPALEINDGKSRR